MQTMKENEKRERQSNIELLRCILMLMVVTLHYNNGEMGGGFLYAKGNNLIFLKLTEALCICAVNCFVLISAYFLSATDKRTLKKPVKLLAMVSAYKLLCYVISVMLGYQGFGLYALLGSLIPNNWFIVLFCVMYVISGYINCIFEKLEKKQLEQFVLISMSIFVLYPTILETGADKFLGTTELAGFGTVTMFGSSGGYTIVNFMLLYLAGGYLKKYWVIPKGKKEKRKYVRLFGSFFICSVLLDFFMSFFSATYTSYSNVFVVAEAVTLFMAFLHMDIKHNTVINHMAKSAFGVYLLHTCSLFIVNFWGAFNFQKYCNSEFYILLLHLLISVFSMYFICMIIDMLCRLLLSWIERLLVKVYSN